MIPSQGSEFDVVVAGLFVTRLARNIRHRLSDTRYQCWLAVVRVNQPG
ncbi:MAG: hypothetical protein ACJAXA_000012 [Candidatus Aldehydirespiratoraceae bacterium]|jgi:hypothetical protein